MLLSYWHNMLLLLLKLLVPLNYWNNKLFTGITQDNLTAYISGGSIAGCMELMLACIAIMGWVVG